MRHSIAQLSLIHGWFPPAVQIIAAVLLVCALARRSARWGTRWLPAMAVVAVAASLLARWYVDSLGVAGNAGPVALWLWAGLTTLAVGVAVVGWPGARWWRRAVSVLAVPLCALGCLVTLNNWVGYFPTVHAAWNQLTSGPLIDQTDRLAVTAMQVTHARPTAGVVVPVDIDSDASGFDHRRELVYLPRPGSPPPHRRDCPR